MEQMASAMYDDALGQIGNARKHVPWMITTSFGDVEIGGPGTEVPGNFGLEVGDNVAGKRAQLLVISRIQEAMMRVGFPVRIFRSTIPKCDTQFGSFELQCALGVHGKRAGSRPKTPKQSTNITTANIEPPPALSDEIIRTALTMKHAKEAQTSFIRGRHSSSRTHEMLGRFNVLEAASVAAGLGSVVTTLRGGRDLVNALIKANRQQSLVKFRDQVLIYCLTCERRPLHEKFLCRKNFSA